jgi:ATP-dependent helicase/nuclease subunit B
VSEVENPEDQLRISPRSWGSLVHEALELFIREVLARPADDQPAPTEPWSPSDADRLLAIGEERCATYEAHGLTGRPVFWLRDKKLILADLARFLVMDSAHRKEHGTRPVAAELAFGLPHADLGTVPIDIPGGRSVHFRGLADRVDIADGGTIEVIDYKTGRPDDFRGLSEDNPDDQGQKLQLTVYGQAARMLRATPDAPVRAEYWFVSARGKFERIGYYVTNEVLARVGETVGTMVSGIEGGVFPPYPTASSTAIFIECPFCDPDGLGVADLRRQFDAKRSDPAMSVFNDLAAALGDAPLDIETEPVSLS